MKKLWVIAFLKQEHLEGEPDVGLHLQGVDWETELENSIKILKKFLRAGTIKNSLSVWIPFEAVPGG